MIARTTKEIFSVQRTMEEINKNRDGSGDFDSAADKSMVAHSSLEQTSYPVRLSGPSNPVSSPTLDGSGDVVVRENWPSGDAQNAGDEPLKDDASQQGVFVDTKIQVSDKANVDQAANPESTSEIETIPLAIPPAPDNASSSTISAASFKTVPDDSISTTSNIDTSKLQSSIQITVPVPMESSVVETRENKASSTQNLDLPEPETTAYQSEESSVADLPNIVINPRSSKENPLLTFPHIPTRNELSMGPPVYPSTDSPSDLVHARPDKDSSQPASSKSTLQERGVNISETSVEQKEVSKNTDDSETKTRTSITSIVMEENDNARFLEESYDDRLFVRRSVQSAMAKETVEEESDNARFVGESSYEPLYFKSTEITSVSTEGHEMKTDKASFAEVRTKAMTESKDPDKRMLFEESNSVAFSEKKYQGLLPPEGIKDTDAESNLRVFCKQNNVVDEESNLGIGDESNLGIGDESNLGIGDESNLGIGDESNLGIGDESNLGIGEESNLGIGDESNLGIGNESDLGIGDESNLGIGDESNLGIGDESNLGIGDESNLGIGDESNLGIGDESNLGIGDESNLGIGDESVLEESNLGIGEESNLGIGDESVLEESNMEGLMEDSNQAIIGDGTNIDDSLLGIVEDSNLSTSRKRSCVDSSLPMYDKYHGAFPAANLFEYQWPPETGAEYYMLQEQICEFLGVKSFKRKYPDLQRRAVDMNEKVFLRDRGVVSETQADLGLMALKSEEVLDLMIRDYPMQYREYAAVLQEKERQTISDKHKKYDVPKFEKSKLADYMKKAVKSAAEFNVQFQRERREDRRAYFDLQTMAIHYPKSQHKVLPPESTKVGSYPVALIPGQFQDYFKKYTPQELNYFPVGTAVYGPPKLFKDILAQPSTGDTSDDSAEDSADDGSDSNSEDGNSSGNESMGVAPLPPQPSTDDPTPETPNNNKSSKPTETIIPIKEEMKKEKKEEKLVEKLCRICKVEEIVKGKIEDLVQCSECKTSGHPKCLELTTEMIPVIRSYPWQCMECKTCVECMDPYDEDKMMFCDRCDRGYHTFCVGVKSIPTGRWECPSCKDIPSKPKKSRRQTRQNGVASPKPAISS